MRVGLLGGTFDPIHLAHLDVAHAAARALRLDAVTLMPASVPPHRSTPVASAAHRFAMAALAVMEHRSLRISDVEMASPGPAYTTDTLDRLEARGVDLSTVFLVTGDAFREIATWKGYPQLLDRCHFAVVSRPGCPAPGLRTLLPDLSSRCVDPDCENPRQPSIFLVDAPTPAISSTDVRRRCFAGESIDGLVPASVAQYIHRHRLYEPGRNPAA